MPTAKVFNNGRSQAVRIPARFRFKTTEVEIEQAPDGTLLLSENHPPVDAEVEKYSLQNMSWTAFLDEVRKADLRQDDFELPPGTAMPQPPAWNLDE